MEEAVQDRWASWVLRRGHAGDAEQERFKLDYLRPIRDRVLDNADLAPDDVLLDVGAGDGLIAFGALDRLDNAARVIFSDISQDLVDHGRELAQQLGVMNRCDFVRASADDLQPIADSSVDVVTTRSVLIYLPAPQKEQTFREFHRVLKPGGRFSIFEPINRFSYPEPDNLFWGFDVTPVLELAKKVKDICGDGGDGTDDSLLDFDEQDLLAFAENAGFQVVRLHLDVEIARGSWFTGWKPFLDTAPNPLAPTQREVIERALTSGEARRFESHLRPLVESRAGIMRSAVAYVTGLKN